MSVALTFFMTKRGLTIEKLAQKSNAKNASDLIAHIKIHDIAISPDDEQQINDYFAALQTVPQAEVNVIEAIDQPVLEKKARGKKKVGKDV